MEDHVPEKKKVQNEITKINIKKQYMKKKLVHDKISKGVNKIKKLMW